MAKAKLTAERIEQILERDSMGQPLMTSTARHERLCQCRDNAIYWVDELIRERNSHGIGAAIFALEKLDGLITKHEERLGLVSESPVIEMHWKPYPSDEQDQVDAGEEVCA